MIIQSIKVLILAVLTLLSCSGRKLNLQSPDGKLKVEIQPGGDQKDSSVIKLSLRRGNRDILLESPLSIRSAEKTINGNVRLIRFETRSENSSWTNSFGERKTVPDVYNEMKLYLVAGDLNINLYIRAYNEGVAFSWEVPVQNSLEKLTITDEKIVYRFPADHYTWSASRAQAKYSKVPLSKIEAGSERPLVIEAGDNNTIALGEAALVDFPRMKFEPVPSGTAGIRSRLHENAVRNVPFSSPWRYIMAGDNPGQLLERNYFILNLNAPSAITDLSWIKPGKVLREATLTTGGGKAAVDFTASHNMQYVEFDAGWYGPENNDASDATAVNVDPARSKGPLDLQEVINYASSKKIGVLLYVNRRALERQIDTILPLFRKWGVAGIKFGFVQVGTQSSTSWLHESIRKAAEYKLIADVHDEYRPTGYSRTWPNFLTQEGIRGDEESPENSHTLITMFTRMIAGPGDNTICYYNERVDKKMGSHASQLAKAVCLFSPLQFLYWYDTPSGIGNEPELEFFNNVPTTWDETRVLYGKIGEYGVIARKKGDEWFIGGINGAAPANLDIKFDFLDKGKKYVAGIYSDDPSVNTKTHVRVDRLDVNSESNWRAIMKSNNGFAMHIIPE